MARASVTITYRNGTLPAGEQSVSRTISTTVTDTDGNGEISAAELDAQVTAAINSHADFSCNGAGNVTYSGSSPSIQITSLRGGNVTVSGDTSTTAHNGSFSMNAVLRGSAYTTPAGGSGSPNPSPNTGGGGGRRRSTGGGGRRSTPNATNDNPSTWTGNPMRIRVKKSDGTWGEWREIPHGQNNDTDPNDAELRQLLGALQTSDTGDMNADVQVEYKRSGSWGSADSFDGLGALYTRAGRIRPGATSGMGNATITYTVPNRRGSGTTTRTVTIQYRLDSNSEGDVSHAEATRISEIFRNVPGYQASWRITQVQAEGKTLEAGAWASRLSPEYRSPNSSGSPDDATDLLNDSYNRGLLARLGRNRSSRRAEQRRLTAMLNNLLRGGRFNWRVFLSYINLSSMRREAVMNEGLSWAVQSLAGIEERQGELNTELRGLNSSDRNRYTSSMTRINNELNELTGQRNAIMSFIRDSKSTTDEGKELAKSLYAELQQEEMLMRF